MGLLLGLFSLPLSRATFQVLRDLEVRSVASMPSAAQHGFGSAHSPFVQYCLPHRAQPAVCECIVSELLCVLGLLLWLWI